MSAVHPIDAWNNDIKSNSLKSSFTFWNKCQPHEISWHLQFLENSIFYSVFRRLLWDLAREQKQQHSWDVVSLWRKGRLLICRVSLLSFLESTAVLRIRVQTENSPLSDTQTCSHDAQKFRPFFTRDSNHLRRLSAVVSQAAITKTAVFPLLVCPGFGSARKSDQTAGRGGVQESHQTVWKAQLSQAESRCQRLTEFIGPKWVCWFNMMSVT